MAESLFWERSATISRAQISIGLIVTAAIGAILYVSIEAILFGPDGGALR